MPATGGLGHFSGRAHSFLHSIFYFLVDEFHRWVGGVSGRRRGGAGRRAGLGADGGMERIWVGERMQYYRVFRVADFIREFPRGYRRGRGTMGELRATAIGIVAWSDFGNRFINGSDFTIHQRSTANAKDLLRSTVNVFADVSSRAPSEPSWRRGFSGVSLADTPTRALIRSRTAVGFVPGRAGGRSGTSCTDVPSA